MLKLFTVCVVTVLSCLHGMQGFCMVPETVDIVYTWVDGSDPIWREARASAQGLKSDWQKRSDADVAHRYQDREELRYSLRSVLKNIPNLGTIFIVTMNQRPNWLANHPQVKIVDHTDIIDAEWLPTFNSQAIESAIHHISGLNEYFLYLNDDFFVAQPCEIEDFFLPNGALRFNACKQQGPTGTVHPHYDSWQASLLNTNNFLNQLFGTKPRHMLVHAPQPLRVSWMYAAEQEFPEIFRANLASPFRDKSNYTMTNGFLHHLWLERGLAEMNEAQVIHTNYSCGTPFANINNQRKLAMIQTRQPQFFCIEDCSVRYPENSDLPLKRWLQHMFPEPAPWELPESN